VEALFLQRKCQTQCTLNIYLHYSAPYAEMLTFNKKFWVELITYFPFTTISVSDTSGGKTNFSMHNKVNKTWEATVLVLPMAVIYEVHHADGLKWHKTHTKFQNDQFRHSSNINVITSTNWKAAVLLLLITSNSWSMSLKWPQMAWYTCFMIIRWGSQVILRSPPPQYERLQCWYYWWGGSYELHHSDSLRWHYIYIPSFMTISWGIQVILRLISI
jgi:hypothetical protein